MAEDRDFKGIWIPKEIFENKDLTWFEKFLLMDIDSLDKNLGCFASNSYFAEKYGFSISRISEIISDIAKKGFIEILQEKELTPNGWKTNRVLKSKLSVQVIDLKTKLLSENRNNHSENRMGPSENRMKPSEKTKCINTNNNINDKINRKAIIDRIKELYQEKYGVPPVFKYQRLNKEITAVAINGITTEIIIKRMESYFRDEYWFNNYGKSHDPIRAFTNFNEITIKPVKQVVKYNTPHTAAYNKLIAGTVPDGEFVATYNALNGTEKDELRHMADAYLIRHPDHKRAAV